MNGIVILAEANAPVVKAEDISSENQQVTNTTVLTDANGAAAPAKKQSPSPWSNIVFIGLIFVVMYFIMFRGPRKKQQQQQQMISSLKKNDRVQTVGGILGTVIEVGETEITIKVDESNNTKMKFLPSAVSRVVEQK
ncbi:MAG: preprotein translocase subunit YajC [Phycisphaerae bacterium]|nr:preprotein translocase subunit YajC [Phycisphaerae bacterium]